MSRFARLLCSLLVAAFALHAVPARAGMIGADAAAPPAPVHAVAPDEAERAKVKQFLETAALKDRLRALGVDGLNASRRVDAMTQEEVHAIAQKIDSMPAGGALSDRDIILILLVTLLLVVVL